MAWSVLVVEGDESVRQEVNEGLSRRKLAVCAVPTVADGYAALLDLPDLVVLDAGLPGAMELCAALQRNARCTPVILLGSGRREDDVVAGFDAGAGDYMIRPIGVGELVSRVMAQLRCIGTEPRSATRSFQAA